MAINREVYPRIRGVMLAVFIEAGVKLSQVLESTK
jgi:hypothetical protein